MRLTLSACHLLRLTGCFPLPWPRSDPAMPTLAVASALQRKHSDGVLDYAQL